VAVVPGHSRHPVAMAPRGGQTQVATMEKTTSSRPAAHERRAGRAHRPSGSREPTLGLYPPHHVGVGVDDPLVTASAANAVTLSVLLCCVLVHVQSRSSRRRCLARSVVGVTPKHAHRERGAVGRVPRSGHDRLS
jgi:hypothetical protein